MSDTDLLPVIRQSVGSAAVRVRDLIASAPDLSVRAEASEWTLQQVAAHLIVISRMYADMAAGLPSPLTGIDRTYLAAESARRNAEITEGDPDKLARLLTEGFDSFLEATADRSGDDLVSYHGGFSHTLAGIAGTLLGDVLLHGWDMAAALGRAWPIDPTDAQLVLAGTAPLFGLVLHPERTRGLDAGFGIELRGGPALTVRFTDGAFSLEPPGGPVDATISADPVAFLMVGAGRLSRYQAIALDLLSVGGDHPDLALGFPDLFVYP